MSAKKPERNAKIIAAVKNGEVLRVIAARFKISMVRVSTICQEAGVFHKKIRKARNAKIIAVYKRGVAVPKIAEQFNFSVAHIRKICIKAGVYMPEIANAKTRKARNAKIIAAYKKGKSFVEIAKQFNLSETHTRKICIAHGAHTSFKRKK